MRIYFVFSSPLSNVFLIRADAKLMDKSEARADSLGSCCPFAGVTAVENSRMERTGVGFLC